MCLQVSSCLIQRLYPHLKPTVQQLNTPMRATLGVRSWKGEQSQVWEDFLLPRSRFYWLLHPEAANSQFPTITWQKNSLERERGRKEPAQFCLNVYQNQAEKLAVCLALAAKCRVTQRQLQSETAGNRASVGVLPGHPPNYFAGGSREQHEQHWTLPQHVNPALGTPGFIWYCFLSLCAWFICSPRCTESPYTSETRMPAGSHGGRHFMRESKPRESRTRALTPAAGCTKIRHRRIILKNKCKWENTRSAWRRCII